MCTQTETVNDRLPFASDECIKLYDKDGNHKLTVYNCQFTSECIDVEDENYFHHFCGDLNKDFKTFLEVLRDMLGTEKMDFVKEF